jgi:hypothetical protein
VSISFLRESYSTASDELDGERARDVSPPAGDRLRLSESPDGTRESRDRRDPVEDGVRVRQ